MPCQSAKNTRKNSQTSFGSNSRARTAYRRNSLDQQLKDHCKHIGGKSLSRLPIATEENYNEFLKVTGMTKYVRSAAPQSKKVKIYPTILPNREIERLKKASKVIDLEEKVNEMEREAEEALRIQEESNKRKALIKQIDEARQKAKMEREKAKGVKDEDLYDTEEKLKVLEKAFLAKHEQEEEVKKANRIILNAKCHVVRDAQIQEKIEIQREFKNDEIKLDKEMLDIAKKSLEDDEIKAEQVKKSQQEYAEAVKKQLETRENIRYLEAERIEQEAKILAQANAALKRDEQRKAKLKEEKREMLREDLNQVAEISAMFKKMVFDQERIAEMRVQAYMKEKEQRERTLAIQKRMSKEEFERKQLKLFQTQQKLMELKTEQGEVALRRDQENKEREFRRKEKEAAVKRKEMEKEFSKSREAQLNEMKQRQALQMVRNEEDFKESVKKLKEEEEKAKREEENRMKMRDKYRVEIVGQMNQKEHERRKMEQKTKNEFLSWKQKEEAREKNIKMVIQSKLQAMRDSNLPEKYIEDVEKQLRIRVK